VTVNRAITAVREVRQLLPACKAEGCRQKGQICNYYPMPETNYMSLFLLFMCLSFYKNNCYKSRTAKFYALALGAESASYRSHCQTVLGMFSRMSLEYTTYSVCVGGDRGRAFVFTQKGGGREVVTEVLQHL
jgi:hypothetical protein